MMSHIHKCEHFKDLTQTDSRICNVKEKTWRKSHEYGDERSHGASDFCKTMAALSSNMAVLKEKAHLCASSSPEDDLLQAVDTNNASGINV